MQRGDRFLHKGLDELYQRGDDQNEHSGLHVADAVRVQQQVLDGPGRGSCQDHDEDNGYGHTDGRVQFLGNAQERADAQEAHQDVVIGKDCCHDDH